MLRFYLFVLMLLVVFDVGAGQKAQKAQEESATKILSAWTCPVHRDLTETEAGKCPICARELVETLVREAWRCPIHAVISEIAPGKCPICDRDLYLVTEEVFYACPMHPEVREAHAGSCPICKMDLQPSSSSRPHQDHNPKHGGLFFMAPDNWHHLEGVYPEDGVFRVFLYDNFSEPMNAKDFNGRAVLEEVFDRTTRQTRELVAYPLLPSPDGLYLEAQVGPQGLPLEVAAKIQFSRGAELDRFDFIFPELSVESESELPVPALADVPGLEIPAAAEDIAFEISVRDLRLRRLVSKGAFNQLYVPALEGKDLALALEAEVERAPPERRRTLRWAVKQLVRSAWLLDDYGDLGNKEMVISAYDLYRQAVEEILKVYEITP